MGHLFYITSSFVRHLKPIGEFKLELLSGNAQFGSKSANFLSRVTLKFDGWPWKTIGHLLYVASSFVHHFIAIGEFKLKLQSGNSQFGSKSPIYCPVWPWNLTDELKKTIGHLFCATSSFVQRFVAIGEYKLELQSKNAQFGSKSTIFFSRVTLKFDMTLKNIRAPLLSNMKLYASFYHHMCIQTGVSVRERLSWVMTSVTLTFDLWPCPFPWTSLLSLVITPENFVMILWWEHICAPTSDWHSPPPQTKHHVKL